MIDSGLLALAIIAIVWGTFMWLLWKTPLFNGIVERL